VSNKEREKETVYLIVCVHENGTVDLEEIAIEQAMELQNIARSRSEAEADLLFPCVFDQHISHIIDKCAFLKIHRWLILCMTLKILHWSKTTKNIFFPSNLFFDVLEKYANKGTCNFCACKICPTSPKYHPHATLNGNLKGIDW
jgi:hypothetical protein